jgi:hypothetical protein
MKDILNLLTNAIYTKDYTKLNDIVRVNLGNEDVLDFYLEFVFSGDYLGIPRVKVRE